MHSLRILLSALPLLLLLAIPLPRALAHPTLLPRLRAAHHDHHHSTDKPHLPPMPTPPAPAPAPPAPRNPVGDCNIAGQHCCQSTLPASSTSGTALTGLLGLTALDGSGGLLGLECTPLAPLLSSGGQCQGTTVCCSGDQTYNGLINIGCSPISL